jgi:hypothetical protein
MEKGRKKIKEKGVKREKKKKKKRGRIILFSFPGRCQDHQFDSVCINKITILIKSLKFF